MKSNLKDFSFEYSEDLWLEDPEELAEDEPVDLDDLWIDDAWLEISE